jgi:ATP-dependent helicase/nuclease subunit B
MRTIEHLERIARDHRAERKVLVCPNRGVGRELLRALAVKGVGWVGFEVTTPAELAVELTAMDLAKDGRAADDFQRRGILDRAIDATLLNGRGESRLADLVDGVGFRDALANAVDALRLAGIDSKELGKRQLDDPERHAAIAGIARRYEEGLRSENLLDTADLLRRAVELIRAQKDRRFDATWLHPELRTRGLAGQLLRLLAERGARSLDADPVFGLDPSSPGPGGSHHPSRTSRLSWLHAIDASFHADTPEPEAASGGPNLDLFGARSERDGEASQSGNPEIELFAAAGPSEELREVLRRTMASGRKWDEVEIVAMDPIVYGCALDALGIRLGIPITYAVGLPVDRTRQGRAIATFLHWVQTGFPAALLMQLLETGDVASGTEPPVGGHRLARRLRRLRIGWGRDRYLYSIEQALTALDHRPLAEESERFSREELETIRAREREELEALHSILSGVLEATPPAPGPLGRGGVRISPADLSRAVLALLRFVPARGPIEIEARGRLVERLDQVAGSLKRSTTFGAAMTILRSHLEIRVPSPGTEGPLPWSSTGGALHFSDLDHGGWTGRPLTFVVGLDAERFPGSGIQDPVLLDADRFRLGPRDLPSSASRLVERRHALAALLARLRGTVVLSYDAWAPAEGRAVAPAAEILQALRLREQNSTMDYEDLRRTLTPIAGIVPSGTGKIDGTDVWMAAIERDGVLLAGTRQVLESYPRLAAGLRARDARQASTLTVHDGRIRPRAELLDPRRNPERVVSSTMLSALGECPLRYLHRYVLGLKPADDPVLDPAAWLTPLERGSLLHELYEHSLERGREQRLAYGSPQFAALVLDVLDETIDRYRIRVPAPSEVVFERERERLRSDARSFVAMVRARGAEWIEPLERWFGYRSDTPAVAIDLPGGGIHVGGRIDRVDTLQDGRVVVVDYKTGGNYGFDASSGTYRQGRLLQHVLYSRVARKLYDRPVARVEFHFPTVKGENEVAAYEIERLAEGERVVDLLLDMVAAGHFVPTEADNDCRFCDHRTICRVRMEGNRVVESPRAKWAKASCETLPEYEPLRKVRSWES